MMPSPRPCKARWHERAPIVIPGRSQRERTRNPETGAKQASGFRVRPTQVGFSRPGQIKLPISGKPEIGGPSRNDSENASLPMTALWTLDDMGKAMRAERSGALPAEVSGISIDSRSIAKGEAFFAIQGENRDGHDFVEAALKNGAAVAVVAADRRGRFAADASLLLVADVLEALRDLARAARVRSPAKVIAVTGSVGKTGSKEALRLAL